MPKSLEDLLELPCLQYTRVTASRYLRLDQEVPNVVAQFNDLAAIREACCAGFGWAVLPVYLVKRELQAKRLRELDVHPIQADQFGVWWLRGNTAATDTVARVLTWLEAQDLG